jgi:hypothetical protein
MCTDLVNSALEGVHESLAGTKERTASLKHLKSIVSSKLPASTACDVLVACLAEPAGEVYGTHLSLTPILENSVSNIAHVDQAIQLDVALAVLPAAIDFVVPPATTETPHKCRSVTIQELPSDENKSVDTSNVIFSACLRLEYQDLTVPWANASTDVRSQQLLYFLASHMDVRSKEARCCTRKPQHPSGQIVQGIYLFPC